MLKSEFIKLIVYIYSHELPPEILLKYKIPSYSSELDELTKRVTLRISLNKRGRAVFIPSLDGKESHIRVDILRTFKSNFAHYILFKELIFACVHHELLSSNLHAEFIKLYETSLTIDEYINWFDSIKMFNKSNSWYYKVSILAIKRNRDLSYRMYMLAVTSLSKTNPELKDYLADINAL